LLQEGDNQMKYFMNALFTPLDMTDYEDDFTGWNEFAGQAPLNNVNWI